MSVPTATYRLQLHAGFGFDDAAAVAGYLHALGVSHVYCSPYLQAAAGSTHGYDVVDHRRVNSELGGLDAHARLCAELRRIGLGQVLDIVPNHMAITGENAWWRDVLENGPASRYARYFDVDWDPPESKLRNTLLLPILGDHYGRVLEAGEIVLAFTESWFSVQYYDHVLPVAPPSVDSILLLAAGASDSDELAFIATSLGRLPVSTVTDRISVHQRHRQTTVLRGLLARLCREQPRVAEALAEVVEGVNADADTLDGFLERQNYRLAHWRTGGRELDYRRFFDIDTLAGLRMEDDDVFADTHELVLGWLEAGDIDGVRIDHPDGLRDPAGYLARLRDAAPRSWLVVEKILEPGEHLRPDWPVDGTSGYDALAMVGALVVDPRSEACLDQLYVELTGDSASFEDTAYRARHEVMRDVLATDISRLTHLLVALCEANRRYRDYSRHELHEALREILACLDVYRAYVPEEGGAPATELARVSAAVARARRRDDLDGDLLGFLESVLSGRRNQDDPLARELCARFQQVSGPVMAKGVEDTAFYRYHRLVALNEVGGTPARFGSGIDAFHRECERLAADWPATMTTLSTHDTKRSEDVRARLAVLSQRPEQWAGLARRILGAGGGRAEPDGDPDADPGTGPDTGTGAAASADAVDGPTRYLLLQTLVGAWPLPIERAAAFARKAVREAKRRTSWLDPDEAYEAAVEALLARWYGDAGIVAEVEGFVASIGADGRILAMAQKLIQLTMPGVPDIYQGCELWDLSLVDPDNRRPVDYEVRRALLAELETGLGAEEIAARTEEGLAKLWVVRQALRARARLGPLGSYRALEAGPAHVAFVRGERLLTLAPVRVGAGHHAAADPQRAPEPSAAGVELPAGQWSNLLTGDILAGGDRAVAGLLARFPVALLEAQR